MKLSNFVKIATVAGVVGATALGSAQPAHADGAFLAFGGRNFAFGLSTGHRYYAPAYVPAYAAPVYPYGYGYAAPTYPAYPAYPYGYVAPAPYVYPEYPATVYGSFGWGGGYRYGGSYGHDWHGGGHSDYRSGGSYRGGGERHAFGGTRR